MTSDSLLASLRKPLSAFAETPPAGPTSEACLNCGSALTGPFCAQCGQRDIPPYPSVRELVTDAFWELSGWDGRFGGTVKALVRAPGRLTLEFLEGRRARFISPLRLYLLASLLYFLVAALAPEVQRVQPGTVVAPGVAIGVGSGPSAVTKATTDARSGTITAAERDSALAQVARAPRILRPMLRRAISDPRGFQRDLIEAMPRTLFVLVPVFAGILGLFYRGKKYPEHLYFSLHFQSFVFLALTLSAAVRFTHVAALSALAQVAAIIWILVYGVLALRRVYGGSTLGTVAKLAAVMALNAMVGVTAVLITIFWISRGAA